MSVEFQRVKQDRPALVSIARRTGGRYLPATVSGLAGRLPASDFLASVYKLGFDCWFQDSADSVDARRAARRLRGRPLMIIAPPNGARGAKNARAVFDAAGADQAILTVAAGEAGLRWMDDPAAISERLKGFLRQVAGWADPDEADEADPLALQPATPTASSPQPPPAG